MILYLSMYTSYAYLGRVKMRLTEKLKNVIYEKIIVIVL